MRRTCPGCRASSAGSPKSATGRARAGIDELIDRALTLTGYDLSMLALPGGRRRLANVRKLMRLGREHEAAHGPDLRGFLALLADREAGRAPENREGRGARRGRGTGRDPPDDDPSGQGA